MKKKSERDFSARGMDKDFILSTLFFEKLLDNSDSAVFVSDFSGAVEFANKKFLEIFCVSKKEILKKNWIENTLEPKKKHYARKKFSSLKGGGQVDQFILPLPSWSGSNGKIRWTFVPLRHGAVSLFLFIGKKEKETSDPVLALHPRGPKGKRKAREEVVTLFFTSAMKCDPETARHSLRVMYFVEVLARKIKLSEKKIEDLKIASLLHDMGKLVVDPAVLFKEGKLSKHEFEHIKKHLNWGSDLLRLICFMSDIAEITHGHHENYNGRGYPEGISGEGIPLEARVLSIADIYEALTADRPYRKSFSMEDTLAIMEYEKGYKLDPRLADIFLGMVRNGEVDNDVYKS